MPSLRESLNQSAVVRGELLRRFGFMPMSLLRLSRGELSRSMFNYQGEEKGRSVTNAGDAGMRLAKSAEGKASAAERKKLGIIGGVLTSQKGTSRTGASIMPAELVEFFVKYYAAPGDVYLDPFMGQGVQMQVAHRYGLHYWGFDLCEEFFRYIEAVRAKIDTGTTTIRTFLADSKNPDPIPDGIGDFCFTSPPYWDIEWYGDDPEQLGIGKSYPDFIAGMEAVARAWLPKFKPGATCVVNVNDFRKDGRFYPYHADTVSLFRRAGWAVHDIWIVEGLIAGLPRVFAADKNSKRIAPKVHEYCIVLRRS